MPAFWRKILEKKANATYTPQPGDWDGMKALLDSDPVLGSSGGSGGATFIPWLIGGFIAISALTAYMFVSDSESHDQEYYQVRNTSILQSDAVTAAPAKSYEDEESSVSLNDLTASMLDENQIASDDSQLATKLNIQDAFEASNSAKDDVLSKSLEADSHPSSRSKKELESITRSEENSTSNSETPVSSDDIESSSSSSEGEAPEAAGLVAAAIPAQQSEGNIDSQVDGVSQESKFTKDKESEMLNDEPDVKSLTDTAVSNADKPATVEEDLKDGSLNKAAAEEDGFDDPEQKQTDEATEDFEDDETIQKEDEEEEESEVMLNLLSRMEFNSSALILDYGSIAKMDKYYSVGGGFQVEWRLSDWRLQTGLNYLQWMEVSGTNATKIQYLDTTITTRVDTNVVSWVDSIWVITGINQGQYVYDSLTAEVYDTSYNSIIDTSVINTEHPTPATKVSSRFSVPITIAYRKRFGNFYGDLGAGLISNFTTYQSLYSGDLQRTSFSLDLSLNPSLGYQISQQLGVEVRFNYYVPLVEGQTDKQFFNTSQRWSVGVGIRYFFQ